MFKASKLAAPLPLVLLLLLCSASLHCSRAQEQVHDPADGATTPAKPHGVSAADIELHTPPPPAADQEFDLAHHQPADAVAAGQPTDAADAEAAQPGVAQSDLSYNEEPDYPARPFIAFHDGNMDPPPQSTYDAGDMEPQAAPRDWSKVDSVEGRKEAVREAIMYAWDSYAKYAWGMDELEPISKQGKTTFGGFGATIVDSMTTLSLAGLHDRLAMATAWVKDNMHFDAQLCISLFETNIRFIGGLLGTAELTG